MLIISKELRLYILFGLFISFMLGMNLLGGKIIPIGPFSTSVALFIVPLSFLATDIVAEVYGRKLANQFVKAGIVSLIVMLMFVLFFVWLPPHARYKSNDAYITIFGSSARIIVASITAFVLSQFHDVWAFLFWKKQTRGKFLWLRTNLSSAVSLTVDTFVFMFLAFYKVTPAYDAAFVLKLAIPYLIFKIIWGMVNTPLVYAGARWLRNEK
jgi:hypothetical protein